MVLLLVREIQRLGSPLFVSVYNPLWTIVNVFKNIKTLISFFFKINSDVLTSVVRKHITAKTITNTIVKRTTFNNGCLGSRNDEERSEMRYVMWIADLSESSNLWTHIALAGPPASMSVWVSVKNVSLCNICRGIWRIDRPRSSFEIDTSGVGNDLPAIIVFSIRETNQRWTPLDSCANDRRSSAVHLVNSCTSHARQPFSSLGRNWILSGINYQTFDLKSGKTTRWI